MPTPETIELPSLRWVIACIHDREPRGGSHVYEQGRHFPVTNLGWLLRHSGEVHDFYVSTYRMTRGYNTNYDVLMAARLEGGRVYVCEFADRTVLRDWLDRPRFRGLRVSWDHHFYIIGSDDYRAIYEQTGGER